MKKQTFYYIAVLALFLCFGKLPASAQPLENLMTVQIPFEFQVNKKLMPAGNYVIKHDPMKPQLLLIQCSDQNASAIVFITTLNLTKEPSRSSLTFNKHRGKHFLSEVWARGRGAKYELTASKAESRLKQLAGARTIHAIPNNIAVKN